MDATASSLANDGSESDADDDQMINRFGPLRSRTSKGFPFLGGLIDNPIIIPEYYSN